MTIVGFNYRRVLMSVAKVKQQQEIKQKTANYELLDEILEGIKVGVDDQKHYFQQYVDAAKAEGLSQPEIWTLAKETLQTHVSLRTLYRWGHEYLTEEAFMEVRQRANLSRRNIGLGSGLLSLGNKTECESCVEAYDFDKVKAGVYTYEYLQQVAIWLHEVVELNCRGK